MWLYRPLLLIFVIGQGLRLVLRRDWARLRARLGYGASERSGPHLWLHAASNGELASARPVIAALAKARPDLPIIVTCNSASGVDLARQLGLPAQLAPFDLRGPVRRFLKRWQVAAHLTMEAEIWPNRVLLCPGPVIVLGGRMTARSARGWARLPSLASRVLDRVTFLSAQDPGSRDRFRDLGVSPTALGPVLDLKSLYTPPPDRTADAALRAAFPRETTWLAASTHPGDDEIVIEAHRIAQRSWPELRLILAPRHPARGPEIARLLDAAGLRVARRSAGEAGTVLLADTLGEMPLWYGLAGIVFIGGTLSDRGGHTPYEPAAFGGALIHGPDVANFRAAFARLSEAGAAREITDAQGLAEALLALRSPEAQRAAGQAAQRALRQDADLSGVMSRVLALLP